MAGIWSVVIIVGPIILIAAIIYAWLRNRNASKANLRQADRATERLQEKCTVGSVGRLVPQLAFPGPLRAVFAFYHLGPNVLEFGW